MSSTEQQLEAAAQRMAEGMGYDWLNIDIYNMGSTLVQADSGETARAGFMRLARLAIGDAPSFDQLDGLYDAQAHEVVGLRAEIGRLTASLTKMAEEHDAELARHTSMVFSLTRERDALKLDLHNAKADGDRLRSVLRSVTCPRPANGDPDGISVEQCCVVLGHCGCDLGDALRGAHDQIATLEED